MSGWMIDCQIRDSISITTAEQLPWAPTPSYVKATRYLWPGDEAVRSAGASLLQGNLDTCLP